MQRSAAIDRALGAVPPDRHVLIAGPTASGKSALALALAEAQGGTIVNADASQVYDCWRILTARPSRQEEARAPHCLYGHVAATDPYSTGHWLREVAALLHSQDRLIVTGGTGLYFQALTRGLAEIPPTPAALRRRGDALPLRTLLAEIDSTTREGIDTANRARVQRAWEVQEATGRGLAAWQAETAPPLLAADRCHRVVFRVERDWLNARIARRVDAMLGAGVLDEVRAVLDRFDPALPAHRAIGAPEFAAHLRGECSLDEARAATIVATRQFAKRQRTWMRSRMGDWHGVSPDKF